MQTWRISRKNRAEIMRKAAAALGNGKVLVCPTDTVYGLVADATDKKAVRRIFQIKRRKQGKPLPIFVKDIAMAKHLARVSPLQERYMRKVWPGKVTVVVQSRGVLPKETGTQDTIGLRIPKHALVQAILKQTQRPLTGTSANVAGKPPLRDSKEILRQFQKRKYRPDILIDAGKLLFSKPSRVIDITTGKPKVLRR